MKQKDTSGTPVQAPSYSESIARLREIVARIETASVDVDELEAVVKEAVELIDICRAKITGTQTGVEKALADLGKSSVAGGTAEELRLIQGLGLDGANPFGDE